MLLLHHVFSFHLLLLLHRFRSHLFRPLFPTHFVLTRRPSWCLNFHSLSVSSSDKECGALRITAGHARLSSMTLYSSFRYQLSSWGVNRSLCPWFVRAGHNVNLFDFSIKSIFGTGMCFGPLRDQPSMAKPETPSWFRRGSSLVPTLRTLGSSPPSPPTPSFSEHQIHTFSCFAIGVGVTRPTRAGGFLQ